MRWTNAKLKDLQARLASAYPDAKCALDHADPFQLVVATVLSAQCTDSRVNITTPALFGKYPDAARLAKGKTADVEALVKSTGFFRNKAKNLLGLANALMMRHGGQVPNDAAQLAALPGVGQKTANVVLANAFGVPALAVDTHIFRVAKRLGLSEANTPEKVEADLCRLFLRADWIELHHQLIFHGRRCCDARKPDCAHCPVFETCPTGTGKIADPHSGLTFAVQEARDGSGFPATQNAFLNTSPEAPKRIISLVPSLTELLVQWGLASRLVGRTRYCIAPKWIRATVPDVGGTKDPNLQRILDLKPDLVILEKDENPKSIADALTEAAIPWMALDIRTLKDCMAAWIWLGEKLGALDQAKARAAEFKILIKPKPHKGPRTLTLVWKDPWIAAGPDTYVGDLVRQSGFTPQAAKGYPRLSEEELDALNPEVILLPTEPFRFTKRHALELQKRFPNALVHIVDGQAMTWYLSRTELGLECLRALLKC